MLLRSILKWQFVAPALIAAGIICLASPGNAGMIISQPGEVGKTELSRLELEKEIIAGALESLGWSREETDIKMAQLSGEEIHKLSVTLEKIRIGGEEDEDSNPVGVILVIAVVLAAITGIYLFSQSNK